MQLLVTILIISLIPVPSYGSDGQVFDFILDISMALLSKAIDSDWTGLTGRGGRSKPTQFFLCETRPGQTSDKCFPTQITYPSDCYRIPRTDSAGSSFLLSSVYTKGVCLVIHVGTDCTGEFLVLNPYEGLEPKHLNNYQLHHTKSAADSGQWTGQSVGSMSLCTHTTADGNGCDSACIPEQGRYTCRSLAPQYLPCSPLDGFDHLGRKCLDDCSSHEYEYNRTCTPVGGGQRTACSKVERMRGRGGAYIPASGSMDEYLWKAELYQDKDHKGEMLRISGGKQDCVNIGCSPLSGKVSSVNSADTCLILYTQPDCRGPGTTFVPGSPSHNDFSSGVLGDIDDKALSFGSCFPGARINGTQMTILAQCASNRLRYRTIRKNKRCVSDCAKNGYSYNWCWTESTTGPGPWDYCSSRTGEDYYGRECLGTCDYHEGTKYKWCAVWDKTYLDWYKTWEYCSTTEETAAVN